MRTPLQDYGPPRPELRSHIAILNDQWICLCGNRAELDGFFPCKEDGTRTEPVEGWSGHYKCDNCKLIVDSEGKVVNPCVPRHCERLRDAINALECEYSASYEHPECVHVSPNHLESNLALCWAWGFEGEICRGNDLHAQRDTDAIPLRPMGGGVDAPAPFTLDYSVLALAIVKKMRFHALKRASYLNDLCERMTATMESEVGQGTTEHRADERGPCLCSQCEFRRAAKKLVGEWRQH